MRHIILKLSVKAIYMFKILLLAHPLRLSLKENRIFILKILPTCFLKVQQAYQVKKYKNGLF
jgi:hypothetical protein